MALRAKPPQNLLDMVPRKNPAHSWQVTEQGLVQIVMERNGLLDRLAQRLKKVPRTLRVDLDAYGSFVWQAIDGARDVHAIGAMIHSAWGAEVEPLYERLGRFMALLRSNGLILTAYPQQDEAQAKAQNRQEMQSP